MLLRARQGGDAADTQAAQHLLQNAEDAYRVQASVGAELEPGAAMARHWKSGGPGRDKTLTHAPLPSAGVWPSGHDASAHPFRLRLIEAEVALRLAHEVTPEQAAGLTPADAAGLVDAMCVSIEIVDSRWQQPMEAPPLLKLADLQSHGALVLGAWRPFEARDWSAQTCVVRIGNAEPKSFRGTHSLQDPTWLLPTFLRHVTRLGTTAAKGTVVTCGTWCGMLPAAKGDRVNVAFDGIGEASVQL
ncbi:MAG TPA: fumarylacetoacetate hydrolase family protein [Ramlibacter sp.]|nr:fumarylacetoacetate hydrolase family protein [Ramlibacter sp.]